MTSPAADSELVLTRRHAVEGGAIFEIVINRPEVHNAVNGAAAAQLLAAWQTFRDDDALCVAIFAAPGNRRSAREPT